MTAVKNTVKATTILHSSAGLESLTDGLDAQTVPVDCCWPSYPKISLIRADLLHPIISGNKAIKLAPHLLRAQQPRRQRLISVGGRYSNHLHALAWLGHTRGYPTVGLVRGFAEQEVTATLRDCQQWGMQLHFLAPAEYRQHSSPAFAQYWKQRYPDALYIDEGGWSPASIEASGYWWRWVPKECNYLVTAVGSGTTLTGLACAARPQTRVVGVPAFLDRNGYQALKNKLAAAGAAAGAYELWADDVGTSFGKLTAEQQRFKADFEGESGVPLDPVYTTKLFYSLARKLAQNPKLASQHIAVLHSGGLQGNRSV